MRSARPSTGTSTGTSSGTPSGSSRGSLRALVWLVIASASFFVYLKTLRAEFGHQRLLGMSLDAGGHLTHGFRPNICGKMFHQQQYGTDPQVILDLEDDNARAFPHFFFNSGYAQLPYTFYEARDEDVTEEPDAAPRH